jgi:hypothetical protein
MFIAAQTNLLRLAATRHTAILSVESKLRRSDCKGAEIAAECVGAVRVRIRSGNRLTQTRSISEVDAGVDFR